MGVKTILFLALGGFALYYAISWFVLARTRAAGPQAPPSAGGVGVGFVTNFFDTLGIGSFATTTSLWKFFRAIDDRVIPGTLNVGHTLPTVAQAFIYIALIEVDMPTLVAMIAAAVLGAWLGAGVVAAWDRRKVQVGMGLALLAVALVMLVRLLQLTEGGEATALGGVRLALGLAGNFALGALMTLGIGLYAPCLILVSLLGMSPITAFPIMMGSCAFLMPVGSVRFLRAGSCDLRAALGLALGGIPAVLVAAYLVKSLPLDAVRWLVVVVVVYTAGMMLRSAAREGRAATESALPAADAGR
jgi:uncharacterized membrane protein YfcA